MLAAQPLPVVTAMASSGICVPEDAGLRLKATCSAVYRDFFMGRTTSQTVWDTKVPGEAVGRS